MPPFLLADLLSTGIVIAFVVIGALIIAVGFLTMIAKFFVKVEQGTALVRTGLGPTKVTFSGIPVIPIMHRAEFMDISVKRIEIYRHGSEGLNCKDNVRADIKVAFFVRVNNASADVLQVAQSIGCRRASDITALVDLFDAKFSEALKTVGKQFDFTELYTEREKFKNEILAHIGTDLNGYVLDDAAIDFLEQTELKQLDPNNILDAEGIKKITDLTAREAVLSNSIAREKEKVIKKQDVEAREAILELERQQEEAEDRQAREIASVKAREQAESAKVEEEERYKSERARITTEEELGIAEQNKLRQILVASKAREKTDAVETERVLREKGLEATERERVVELADIEKEKALEEQRRQIQDVIRERVVVERAVVEEQEKIKDTEEIAAANRAKTVAVTAAESKAQEAKVAEVQKAEAGKAAAVFQAEEILIEANANREAAEQVALGKMKMAEALQAETAAAGLAEAEVMDAKAGALDKYGAAEAQVMRAKGNAEAEAVAAKAEAMKKLDGVGKEHEEFKLQLEKRLKVELAEIGIQKDIAAEQAKVLAEALKSAKIDIVGGDGAFFDNLINAITRGKQVDRFVDNSQHVQRIASHLSGDGPGEAQSNGEFGGRLKELVRQTGVSSEDVKNLTIAALLGKAMAGAEDEGLLGELKGLMGLAKATGASDKRLSEIGG